MLDGGCVVAFMEAQTVPSHLGHPTIIRLDNDGNLMWTYVYPDSNLYGITNPLLTPNGDLACAFARNDAYFLRLSDTGDSLESRFVCHIGGSQSTRRLINANETGYTIVTDELLRITPNGQFLWSQAPQILVASDFVLYQDVVSLPDGGYLLAGNYVSEPTEVYWNTFILELDQERPLIIDTVLATAMNSGVQVMLSSLWEYQSQTIEFRRDTSPDGEFSVIASVPPNNEFEGSSYDIWDEDIIPGQTYWYLVTVSNLDGRTWEYREHMVSATALGTDDLPNVPREFALTAYPNPFNLSTTLSLSIPHAVEARVVLHDINGREAMVFAPRHFDAGIHTFAIDAARLASGVYFVSLTSETPLAIQKLLLLK